MGLVFGMLAVSLLVGIAVVEVPRSAGRLEPLATGESSNSWEWRRGRGAQA